LSFPTRRSSDLGKQLSPFFFFRVTRKDFLHAKELIANHVNLAIAAIVREVTLGEDGLAATIHFREFDIATDNTNIVPTCSLVWLDDERTQFQQRKQLTGVRRNVGVRSRHACGL